MSVKLVAKLDRFDNSSARSILLVPGHRCGAKNSEIIRYRLAIWYNAKVFTTYVNMYACYIVIYCYG